MHPYVTALLILTGGAFLLYGYDKLCAINDMRRVPERYLFGVSLLGGAAGGLMAMVIFRHKIRKPVFYAAQIAGLALHSGLAFYLLVRQ